MGGLTGIHTEDATEENALSIDAAVAEAVAINDLKEDTDSQEGSNDATQPLSIAVGGGTDSDSQDGQVTAEIVQADMPSPGKFCDYKSFTFV